MSSAENAPEDADAEEYDERRKIKCHCPDAERWQYPADRCQHGHDQLVEKIVEFPYGVSPGKASIGCDVTQDDPSQHRQDNDVEEQTDK